MPVNLFTNSHPPQFTHCMEQSPPWEANRFSAGQELPCNSRNWTVHYCVYKCPPPVPFWADFMPISITNGAPSPCLIWTAQLLQYISNCIPSAFFTITGNLLLVCMIQWLSTEVFFSGNLTGAELQSKSDWQLLNPSAWGHLNPSSYCDVGRLFYGVFKLWTKLQRKKW